MGCIVLGPGGVAGVMGAVGSSGPPRSSIVLVAGRIASERETLSLFFLRSRFIMRGVRVVQWYRRRTEIVKVTGSNLTGAPNSEKIISNRDWFPTVISHEPKPRRVW